MGLFDRPLTRIRQVLGPVLAPTPGATPVRDMVDDPNDLPTGGYGGRGGYGGTQLLFNALTNFGTPNDPSWMNRFLPQRTLRRAELFALGRNALSFRALNLLGSTATSEGWKVVIEDKAVSDKLALAKQVANYERKLSLPAKCARAICRGRQYGDAIVLLGIDDTVDGVIDFAKPVDPYAIRTIKWAVVIDRRDFDYHELASTDSDGFGDIESYSITDINGVLEDGVRYGPSSISYAGTELEGAKQRNGGRLIVHASRVLSFRTVDGYSLLDTIQDSIGAYLEAAGSIKVAAREMSVVKYKIGSWARKMWSENAGLAYAHLSLVDRAKSAYNAWVVDFKDEDVERVGGNVSGVDKLINPFMVWLAAAIGVPVTVFWGVSPGGFGKGEAERETWHESVYAFQTTCLEPQLTKLHGYILAAWDGPRLTPNIARRIEFADLSPPDEQVRAELRGKSIEDLVRLRSADIITRDEARAAIPEDDMFSVQLVELDDEDDKGLGPMAVGAITGTVAIMQAVYPTGIPIEAARVLQMQVDPQRFTSDVVAGMYPELTLPPTPEAALNPAAEPDTEDTSEDPVEELMYSSDPIPLDAMEAADLAELFGLTRRQAGRITKAAREGKFRAFRFFGNKPRFSRAEVEAAWRLDNEPGVTAERDRAPLITQGWIWRTQKDERVRPEHRALEGKRFRPDERHPTEGVPGEKPNCRCAKEDIVGPHGSQESRRKARREAREKLQKRYKAVTRKALRKKRVRDWSDDSLCVVIRAPDAIARQCPYKPTDVSPPHVTLAYVSECSNDQLASVVELLRAVFAHTMPFTIDLGSLSYFDDTEGDGRRVAYVDVSLSLDAQQLHGEISAALTQAGCRVHERGHGFVPHLTLAYLDDLEDYDGLVPQGSWTVESLEVWRGSERCAFELAGGPPDG